MTELEYYKRLTELQLDTLAKELENLREELDTARLEELRMAEELDEFKAKVVEVLGEATQGGELHYEEQERILEKLGLPSLPSRFRVSFEVEADTPQDAAYITANYTTHEILSRATVERIEE